MDIIDSLFNDKPVLASDNDEIILGPISQESETGSATVTQHSLEDGSNVTDHVKDSPEKIQITTIMIDKDVSAKVVGMLSEIKTVSEKIDLLKMWKSAGELLVYTGPVFSGFLKDGYDISADDMVITSLNITRSIQTGKGVQVTISLQKVHVVQALFEDILLPQGAKSKRNKGLTSTKKSSAETKSSSIAWKMFQ